MNKNKKRKLQKKTKKMYLCKESQEKHAKKQILIYEILPKHTQDEGKRN